MMTTPGSASSSLSSRSSYACTRCADRKVKCDRQKPCSACVKHNAHCNFNPIQPSRPRHKRVKVKALTDRLRHYEALLQERGIEDHSAPSLDSAQDVAADRSPRHNDPKLEIATERNKSLDPVQHGRHFNFIENSLWQRVIQESQESDNTLDDPLSSSDPDLSDNEFGFILSNARPKVKLEHPMPERIAKLWKIFVEGVDPLTKIIHVPTLHPTVRKVISNSKTVPRTLEALMFAIYSVAVMSLKDDECKRQFSENRTTLISQYVSATELALLRAKFMQTTSLAILQALVLHLLSVRELYEPRAVWTLTGVAVRIAQGMGLEQDGTSLGLSFFETEIRRRVWWQLKLNDVRTAELCGLAKFRDLDPGTESPKWPTNLNDDELYPSMSAPLTEAIGLTDVAFVALRCELAKFAVGNIVKIRQQGMTPGQWGLDTPIGSVEGVKEAYAELEEILESKYLRYCDPSQPLHLVVMLVARYGMNVIRFMTNHPRRWPSTEQAPLSERQMVWDICIKLLEQYSMILTTPLIRGFVWHAAYFQHWHTLIHVLDTLRANPNKVDATKAWRLIGITYENIPNMITDLEKPIHLAVCNLCLKAYNALEAASCQESTYFPPVSVPNFVVQLRQQREILQTQRDARKLRGSRSMNSTSHSALNHVVSPDMDYATNMSGSSDLRGNTALRGSDSDQRDDANAGMPSSLFNEFEDNVINGFDAQLDELLASNWNMDIDQIEATSWEQWDLWLTESNIMRP